MKFSFLGGRMRNQLFSPPIPFPPHHNTRVQCSDCRLICKCIFMMYVYRLFVCVCVCVCVCVYLTSAHASDLLDRSRQISRGNTQQRKSVVRYTCHQWKVILHRFFALNVLGLDGTMLRINISSCLE